MDFNLNNSTWTESNSNCNFPSTIYLDILTSKAGAVNNPQEYIVSARLSTKNEDIRFMSNDEKDLLNVKLRFITNFVPLTEDRLTATRNAPNIIPGLPNDIAYPFTQARKKSDV